MSDKAIWVHLYVHKEYPDDAETIIKVINKEDALEEMKEVIKKLKERDVKVEDYEDEIEYDSEDGYHNVIMVKDFEEGVRYSVSSIEWFFSLYFFLKIFFDIINKKKRRYYDIYYWSNYWFNCWIFHRTTHNGLCICV